MNRITSEMCFNSLCAGDCPIEKQDLVGMEAGYPEALEDYERHAEESETCAGAAIIVRGTTVLSACPRFGLEIVRE